MLDRNVIFRSPFRYGFWINTTEYNVFRLLRDGNTDLFTLEQVEHFPEGTSLRLDDGERIDCRLLVDCSGHRSELVERSGVDNPGVQIAYGAEVEVIGKRRKDCCREGWTGDVISAEELSARGGSSGSGHSCRTQMRGTGDGMRWRDNYAVRTIVV